MSVPSDTTILTAADVCHRLTISEATLRRYARAGGDFPAKLHLGPRRVGFIKSEVDAWISTRQEAAKAALTT